MYWSFEHKGISYFSWGQPRRIPEGEVTNLKPRYDIPIYNGVPIKRDETICFLMQGDATLGLGDSIWLISYIRDVYRLKARRLCRFLVVSSPSILKFYKHFLPSSMELREEYLTEKEFMECEHKLPAMYFWHDINDNANRSWVDNRSLLEKLYNWSGIQYDGLPDWGEFTDEKLLYPQDSFYSNLNLDKNEKYVYFQWHSSGHTKNLPPKTNIKLIKHIIKKYGYKVYVVGRLKCLDSLNSIPGVVNLSGKTEGNAKALFTLAFNSQFIVCPDSAGVHLSEAYRVPGVCILATLPPSYICNKYRIPAFMYGKGHCPYRPCGIVHHLPKEEKCPKDTGDYCKVLEDVDLELFDRCVEQSYHNLQKYRNEDPTNFYQAMDSPISMVII